MTPSAFLRIEVPPPRVTPAVLLLLSANGLRMIMPLFVGFLRGFPSPQTLLFALPTGIGTLVFAVLAVHSTRQLLRKAPVLVVDDTGVTDGVTQVCYAWSDITGVSSWRGWVRLRLEGRLLSKPVGAWHPLAPSRALMERIEAGIAAARASERSERSESLKGIRLR